MIFLGRLRQQSFLPMANVLCSCLQLPVGGNGYTCSYQCPEAWMSGKETTSQVAKGRLPREETPASCWPNPNVRTSRLDLVAYW